MEHGVSEGLQGSLLFSHGILPFLSALFLDLVYLEKGTEEDSSIVMSIGIASGLVNMKIWAREVWGGAAGPAFLTSPRARGKLAIREWLEADVILAVFLLHWRSPSAHIFRVA